MLVKNNDGGQNWGYIYIYDDKPRCLHAFLEGGIDAGRKRQVTAVNIRKSNSGIELAVGFDRNEKHATTGRIHHPWTLSGQSLLPTLSSSIPTLWHCCATYVHWYRRARNSRRSRSREPLCVFHEAAGVTKRSTSAGRELSHQ